MVSIIDYKDEAAGARFIEFEVHQSPTDPDRAAASWRFPENGAAIEQSRPDNALEMEFRLAVDCADRHGIPFVWVNDPDQLVPPWLRPMV